MQDIISKVHVHMPFHLFPEYREMILKNKLNLEIYFHHWALQSMDKSQLKETAKTVADAGMKINFHAPFLDLRPGAFDDKIRRISIDRMKQAVDLAPYFRPLKIVCHASFDENYYVNSDDLWLEHSVGAWKELADLAKGYNTMIALENVYEKNPRILRRLFNALSHESVCFCFDTGHFNVYSHEPLSVWLKALGKYLRHMHLHDNFGSRDQHLPVGAGTFPFNDLSQYLRGKKTKPSFTLEAHNPKALWQSLGNIKSMELV